MRGVSRLALGGEGVLDVGEPQIGTVGQLAVKDDLVLVGETKGDAPGFWIDVRDLGGGAVAQPAVFGMDDVAADLDLVAGMEAIGASGHWERVGPELPVLMSDRLGAGVEFVEVVVGGLRDHDRPLPDLAVLVGGVERGVLGAGRVGVVVDSVAGGVSADRLFVITVPEEGLVAAVCRVVGALVLGQLGVRARLASGGLEVRPEPAGADRLVLARVADLDQPRT